MGPQQNPIVLLNCESKLAKDSVAQITTLSGFRPKLISRLIKTPAQVTEALMDCEVAIVGLTVDLPREVFESLPKLKYVGVYGTSLRRIDLEAAAERGVRVTRVTEYCDWDTALFVIAEILNLSRGLGPVLWKEAPSDIRGKVLGLIGLGAVAIEVAHLAHVMGMRVQYTSRTRKPALESASLRYVLKKDLLATSDFVSLHTPPHVEVLDDEDFSQLRTGTALITTTVGPSMNVNALHKWLKNTANCLVLDSIACEAYPDLASGPRVVCSPRSAYRTTESIERLSSSVIAHLRDYLTQQPQKGGK